MLLDTEISFPRNCKLVLCWTLTVVVVLFAASNLVAQSTTSGDVSGVVSDPSGAVIPNATVTLKSSDTGRTSVAKTTNSGFYRFPLLTPGRYTITVTSAGFNTGVVVANIAVGQATSADVHLALASQTQVVEVTSEASALQTENGNISTTMSQAMIENAPNPGNDMTYIAQTSPGAVMNTQSGYGNFSTFGLPATSNLFTVNGMNDNDPFLNLNNSGATNLMLGANDIAEATVVNNGYSGQYGGLAGSNVNYVSKSGTNAWHGNLEYFYNDDTLNANSWINNHSSVPRSFALAQQYAGSIGGPIKKNKAFIFFNAEGLYVALPTSTPTLVPSPQIQSAILGNVAAVAPTETPFYNTIFGLYNHAPGVSGAVAGPPSVVGGVTYGYGCPTSGVTTPVALSFVTTGSVPCALQYISSVVNHTHENMQMGRFDYNISNNDRAYVHIRRDVGVQATYTDPLTPVFNLVSNQPEYDGQFSETHTFGSRAANQFVASAIYYSAIFNVPNVGAALSAFPFTLSFAGNTFYPVGNDNYFAEGRNVTQFQIVDDYSRSVGKHDLKFGMNFVRDDVSDHDILEFAQTGTTNFAETLDAFFAGSTSFYQAQFPSGGKQAAPIAVYGLGFYVQDEWRARSNLRLTISLRAEHNSNPVCQTNCFGRFATNVNLVNPATSPNAAIVANQSQALTSFDALNWEPRFGFAYTPFGSNNTVFRGGFGIFIDRFPATIADSMLFNPPFNNGFIVSSSPSAPIPLSGAPAAAAAANAGFLAGYASGASATNTPGFPTPNFVSPAASLHSPRYQEWNFQIEQSIGKVGVFSANYVGTHGIHEAYVNGGVNAFDPNGFGGLPTTAPLPNFGAINEVQTGAISNYNGVTLTFSRRYHSLQFQANYTWSHALDEISNGGILPFSFGAPFSDNLSNLQPQDPFNLRLYNYGNADYDVRHYFSMNGVWDTPKMGNKYLNALAQWTVGGVLFVHTGYPYTVTDGGLTGTLAAQNYVGLAGLPNPHVFANQLVGGVTTCSGAAAVTPCPAMLADFASVSPTGVTGVGTNTWGNQRRNQLVGPGFSDVNITLMKKFNLPHSDYKLGLGAQFFNLFNHPNFDQPVSDIANTAQYGTIQHTIAAPTSMYGSFLGADASPRQIQLRATLDF